jgi:hypothetical protein
VILLAATVAILARHRLNRAYRTRLDAADNNRSESSLDSQQSPNRSDA